MEVVGALRFGATTSLAAILSSIIDIKFTKTKTSFLKILDKSLNNDFFCYNYNM